MLICRHGYILSSTHIILTFFFFLVGNLLVVMFEGMDLWQTVTSQTALNDGKWQHVVIEIMYGELRVTLNRQHFISELPKEATGVIDKAQPLFVGGKPRLVLLSCSTMLTDLKQGQLTDFSKEPTSC